MQQTIGHTGGIGRGRHVFCGRHVQDMKQRGKLQRDFIDFVLRPLWAAWCGDRISQVKADLLGNL